MTEALRPSAPAHRTPDEVSPRRALVLGASDAACDELASAAARLPATTLVGRTSSPDAARVRLESAWPDLLLVDGDLLAGDAARRLAAPLAPWRSGLVVLGRGVEQALAAFEIGARGFLSRTQPQETLARRLAAVAARIAPRDAIRDLARQVAARRLATRRAEIGRSRYLLVRERNRMVPVPIEAIVWIRGASNYVTVRWPGGEIPLRAALSRLATELDPTRFARIHRSWIVAVERIARVGHRARGGLIALLEDGTRVAVSERYRPRLVAALGGALAAQGRLARSRERSE